MGGTVDWAAMDLMVELLGVEDIEGWIHALTQIRDYQTKRPTAGQGTPEQQAP